MTKKWISLDDETRNMIHDAKQEIPVLVWYATCMIAMVWITAVTLVFLLVTTMIAR